MFKWLAAILRLQEGRKPDIGELRLRGPTGVLQTGFREVCGPVRTGGPELLV